MHFKVENVMKIVMVLNLMLDEYMMSYWWIYVM